MADIKVTIAGKELEVSKLNLRSIRDLTEQGHLEAISEIKPGPLSAKFLTAIAAVVAASLQRKSPEITVDWILDNTDAEDIAVLAQLLPRLLQVSGFKSKDATDPNAVSP